MATFASITPDVDGLETVELPMHVSEDGFLTVAEKSERIPFDIRRAFWITGASPGAARGNHAHKELNQFMICLNGRISLTVDDGGRRRTFVLDSPRKGVHVPPGIWAEQSYDSPGSALLVLCDAAYDERDYIRNYDDFKGYSAQKRKPSK